MSRSSLDELRLVLKIDVADDLHRIRRENSGASSAEIEQGAYEVLEQIRRKNQQSQLKQVRF